MATATETIPLDDALDIETSLLIARLSLEDLEEVETSRKGKARADLPLTDEELAWRTQAESFHDLLSLLVDQRMACSLQSALESDRVELEAFLALEEAENDDHQAALALSRGESLPAPTSSQKSMEQPASDLPSVSRDLENTPKDTTLKSALTNPPVTPASVPGSSGRVRLECVICGDPVTASRSFHAAACGHHYCRACLINLVEASTRDESLYPLRCCQQHLQTDEVIPFLPSDLRSYFRTKSLEFGTLSLNRVYCASPRCSIFLGPSAESRADIVCPQCKTITCSNCKSASHPNEGCADNAATLEVKALAQAERWQTCPGCRSIVELNHGCYHITCRCRTQFCYLCAAKWKNCTCPQWDDALLLDDAHRRVVNEFGENAAVNRPVLHAERVHRRMEELRVNHDCLDHRWTYRHGGGYCNECNYNLPTFMMRCINCQLLACKRCAQNRL